METDEARRALSRTRKLVQADERPLAPRTTASITSSCLASRTSPSSRRCSARSRQPVAAREGVAEWNINLDLDPPLDLDGGFGPDPTLEQSALTAITQPYGRNADTGGMLELNASEGVQRSIRTSSPSRSKSSRNSRSKGHADIADRLRRAAQSQPLNIAEGRGGLRIQTLRTLRDILEGRRWSARRS